MKSEIDYEKCSTLLFKLITQLCDHYQDLYGNNGMQNIVMMYKRDIANQIYAQMMQHFYCENGMLVEEVIGTGDYNLTQHYNFVERMSLYAKYTGNIKSILFDEMQKGVFSSAKFDSYPELMLARVLEGDKNVKNWLRPAKQEFIYYAYIFFRTDSIVVKNGKTIELCERILDIYRIINEREQRSYWGRTSEREFKNLGLRMILTSGLPIMDFEVQYIQDCLSKASYEDANVFFEVALQGTLYNDVINLDTYLNILFGLGDKDKICKVFSEIISDDMEESFYPEDFIIYHRHLIAKESDKAKQIQKVAELFLICFELRDSDMQNKLHDYFYGLSTHDKVQKEMFDKMKEACNMEGSHG